MKKRITGFTSDNHPGLSKGQIIDASWVRYDIGGDPLQWWVDDDGLIYGWCTLEDVADDVAPSNADRFMRLGSLAGQLGPRAMSLLIAIAERLVKGAKEHGDFDAPKELQREALEEHLDAVVYLALELLQGAKQ